LYDALVPKSMSDRDFLAPLLESGARGATG
jgi:hypothetical protein